MRCCIIFIFFMLSFSIYPYAVTFEELSEGAKYGDALVTSGQGKIIYSWVREDSTSSRAKLQDLKAKEETPENKIRVRVNTKRVDLNYAFSGPKVRCDEKSIDLMPTGKTYQRNWQSAYNGEKVDFLQLDGTGANGLVRPKGAVRSDTAILRSDKFDPRFGATSILGVPVGSFLSGTSREGQLHDITMSGEETLDSVPCIIVEAAVSNSDIRYKVWIAPGQMYRPKKIEVKSDAGLKTITNVFKNHGGDIWFPELVTVNDYYFDETTGKPILAERYSLTLADTYKVNTEISDALFWISFPKGLNVYDWRTGTTQKTE